jgi:DNA-directed RNA polymerase subunit RPC12/RpoP
MFSTNGDIYIQCTQCGHVHKIKRNLEVEYEMYVYHICSKCGHNRGLYLGDNLDDFYELYSLNEDARYYIYNKL